jgi:hypothetical protein
MQQNAFWEVLPEQYYIGPALSVTLSTNHYEESGLSQGETTGSRSAQGGIQQKIIFSRSLITTLFAGGALTQTLQEELPAENSWNFVGNAAVDIPFFKRLLLGTFIVSQSNRSSSGISGVYQVQAVAANVNVNTERIAFIARHVRVFPNFSISYSRSTLGDTDEIPLLLAHFALLFPFTENLGAFVNYSLTRQGEARIGGITFDPIQAYSVSAGLSLNLNMWGNKKGILHRLPRVL